MDILKMIRDYLTKATYVNPDDERLFIYRDEKHKWFGLSINFGHPKAKRCLLSFLGLVILYVLLSGICCRYDRFLSLVIETTFVVFFSWRIRKAYDIAEYGGVKNGREHDDVHSKDVQKPYHRRINSYFIVNLVIFMLPIFYAFNVRVHDHRYCIFLCVLFIITLFQMTIFVRNYYFDNRKDATK